MIQTGTNINALNVNNVDDHNLPMYMNKFISIDTNEWILFYKDTCFSTSSVKHLLPKTNEVSSDVYIYTNNEYFSYNSISTELLIKNYDINIIAIMIKRSLLIYTGCFNEFLGNGCILEFLCRASITGTITSLNLPSTCKKNDISDVLSPDIIETLAYIICRSSYYLGSNPNVSMILSDILNKLRKTNAYDMFIQAFNKFIDSPNLFKRYCRNTAPIYIISGNDTCNGILNEFANELAMALAAKGQAIITTDGRYIPYSELSDIEGKTLKALIGFQAPVLFNRYFSSFDSPKFQFWFDDPVFFDHMFNNIDDSVYLLCQDGFHSEYFKEFLGIKHSYHIPPAVRAEEVPDYDNRDMDIIFIGSYRTPVHPALNDKFADELCEYMLEHTDLTYEQCISSLTHAKGTELNKDDYLSMLTSYTDIYRYVRSEFRTRVVKSIVSNNIKLHVYGNSWHEYSDKGRENLIIHPDISSTEIISEMRRARLSLNIMSWHKDGMTERIISSMLAGAVCVSDETLYLKNNFSDNEIVLYKLTQLDELPIIIRKLLADKDRCIQIAQNAYQYASQKDTWDIRSSELLNLMDQ